MPRTATHDAQTAVDIALQLRDQQDEDDKPAHWERFRELAAEFASRAYANVEIRRKKERGLFK